MLPRVYYTGFDCVDYQREANLRVSQCRDRLSVFGLHKSCACPYPLYCLSYLLWQLRFDRRKG